jgi:hypothetical protein
MDITRDSLFEMLAQATPEKRVHIIGRALVALFAYQTAGEQHSNATTQHNNVGFNGADARSGSLTAKSYLKHKTLQDWQVERWMKLGKSGYPRLCKYATQLDRIVKTKEAKKEQ